MVEGVEHWTLPQEVDMNFNQMRTIQKGSIAGGSLAEIEVEKAVIALKKEIKPFILSLGSELTDRTMLAAIVTEKAQSLLDLEHENIERYTKMAYEYAMNRTIAETYGQYVINSNLAIGYTANWLRDNKTANMRATANVTKVVSSIKGLLLSWQGTDRIVLMGLIFNELDKLINQFKTLIRTELQAAWAQGARDAFLMQGCYYAVIENNDPCDRICASRVGEHQVSLYGRLGIELPPYHPNCQCIFLGVFVK